MENRNMTLQALKSELEAAVSSLFSLAEELTWNRLSHNCKFILTEIKDNAENCHEQRRLRKLENDKKISLTLEEILPALQALYDNLYDINLQIYRSRKTETVIEIRYYPKSSLDEEFRQKIMDKPPMLHCKISMPPWLMKRNKQFDINWEHNIGLNKWRFFLLKLKLKTQRI
jgi:hypothetical protein